MQYGNSTLLHFNSKPNRKHFLKVRTSPISCSCWINSFMCSSPAKGFTLQCTKSTNVNQGTTGNVAEFLRTPGNQFKTPSKKPVHFGTPCYKQNITDNKEFITFYCTSY